MFGQRLGVAVQAQRIGAHFLDLVFAQRAGYEQPAACVKEIFLLFGQRNDRLTIGVVRRHDAVGHVHVVPHIFVYYVGIAHGLVSIYKAFFCLAL